MLIGDMYAHCTLHTAQLLPPLEHRVGAGTHLTQEVMGKPSNFLLRVPAHTSSFTEKNWSNNFHWIILVTVAKPRDKVIQNINNKPCSRKKLKQLYPSSNKKHRHPMSHAYSIIGFATESGACHTAPWF